ncbi:hypothetical protein [Polyangium sp. 15x6]|uniref:hypothetical protein n=1 Tax=Polyangium sp. 15x6 TaxID=3042687 RepID=UPI00249CBB5B|nr:hypothetical protein [Polyangium sp. 15x6]MDI3282091.1 hypothetical protein [Polyangium sp. 15x6]
MAKQTKQTKKKTNPNLEAVFAVARDIGLYDRLIAAYQADRQRPIALRYDIPGTGVHVPHSDAASEHGRTWAGMIRFYVAQVETRCPRLRCDGRRLLGDVCSKCGHQMSPLAVPPPEW